MVQITRRYLSLISPWNLPRRQCCSTHNCGRIEFSETSVLTRATRCRVPEDIFHWYRREYIPEVSVLRPKIVVKYSSLKHWPTLTRWSVLHLIPMNIPYSCWDKTSTVTKSGRWQFDWFIWKYCTYIAESSCTVQIRLLVSLLSFTCSFA
jgi:hypothetical protein